VQDSAHKRTKEVKLHKQQEQEGYSALAGHISPLSCPRKKGTRKASTHEDEGIAFLRNVGSVHPGTKHHIQEYMEYSKVEISF
jgi:hypothetical protein